MRSVRRFESIICFLPFLSLYLVSSVNICDLLLSLLHVVRQDLELLQVFFFIVRVNRCAIFFHWLPSFFVEIWNVLGFMVLTSVVPSSLPVCELKSPISAMGFRFRIFCINRPNCVVTLMFCLFFSARSATPRLVRYVFIIMIYFRLLSILTIYF